jgi:anti-sigma regulatory factor (Ser/Thr protein kinase)
MEENLLLVEKFKIQGRDFDRAGEASSQIKTILKKLNIPPSVIRKATIAAYETEMNIIIYAYHGVMTLKVYKNKVKVIAEDKGPGIPDINLAMQEGYSTAPPEILEMGFGAGMGLANIKKNSDILEIKSNVNKGTTVTFEVSINEQHK